jgi:hypothetical protein
MRFVRWQAGTLRKEDDLWQGGHPNYFWWWFPTQMRFKFFLYFKFEYRKSRTIKGDSMTTVKVWTKCSYLYQFILIPYHNSHCNSLKFLLLWAGRQCRPSRPAVPPITAVGPQGGINTSFTEPQRLFLGSPTFRSTRTEQKLSLSPSIVAHCISQAKLWFPSSKLERNYNKLRLESRSGDSQSLRALGSRLPGVLEFVTLGALFLAG